jgi:tetratricopeptide (TPR) repeat protein
MRKPLIVTGILVACTLLLAACGSDEEALAEHFERGKQYAEAEDWREAIIEFRNVLQIDPNHADAHFELAQAYLKTEKPKEGFWELRETVRLDSSNHDARLQFAQIAIFAGEVEEALGHADAVLEAEPTRVDAALVKGQAHDALKQPEEAEAAFRLAVENGPDNHGAHLMLAAYLRRQGDRDGAEEHLKRAIELEPNAKNYISLAAFYAEQGSDAEAEAAYRGAVKVAEGDEDIVLAYRNLGSFVFRQPDGFDEAIAVLEEGVERAENPVPLLYIQARMYRTRGDAEKADALAQRAAETNPEDPGPYLILSAYRSQSGDLQGALEAAEAAAAVSPEDDPSAKLRVAEVLFEIGVREGDEASLERGREILDEVTAADPENPAALFVQAKLALAEGRLEDAIQAVRLTIDKRPDWAQAHLLLGSSLAASGQRTAARAEFARALELDPNLSEARRALVSVHSALGEHEYAIEEGRRYLADQPDATDVRIQVAQSLVLTGRPKDALKEVEAIPEEARDVEANFAIGRIHLGMENVDEARRYMELALAQQPGTPDILDTLLDIDRNTGRLEQSIARIDAAVAENPEDARLQQLAAKLALIQGRDADAEAALKRAIELSPDLTSSYRMLARFYARTGRTEETIRTYEQALEVKPDQPQIHHFLGVLYEMGGDEERAIEHYETAIRYEPNLGESKNNLAYIYAENGENLDRALDLAQEAKALMPDSANVADTLGWVLYRRGVPSAAIGYLKEAAAGFPAGDPTLGLVRHHLALAYEASGDKENARISVEEALAVHENQVQAARAAGANLGDPPWVKEARKMKARL